MKFLKTYEELRIDTISLNNDFIEMNKIIEKNCKDFSWDDAPILRSVLGFGEGITIIDPKKYTRKSRSNKNYYTYIMEHSERWKDYPKRSKSLICSLTSPLWVYELYRVIPFDGAKFGVCSKHDIWYSFNSFQHNILPFLSNLNDLNTFYFDSDLTDESYDSFKKRIDEIGEKIKSEKSFKDDIEQEKIITRKLMNTGNQHLFVDFFKEIKEYYDNGKTIHDYFDDVLDPIENDFKLLDYKEVVNIGEKLDSRLELGREIWTDSKCILVSVKYLNVNHKP